MPRLGTPEETRATAAKPAARGIALAMHRLRAADTLLGYGLAAPLLLWLAGVMGYPLASTIWLSLHDQRIIGTPAPFVGLKLYRKLIFHPDVVSALIKSLEWTLGYILVSVPLGIGVALLLFQNFRGRDLLRTWILIPWILPPIVMAVLWKWMLSGTLGIVNEVLVEDLRLLSKPILFLETGGVALITLIFLNAWRFVPFRGVTFLAAMMSIDQELFDAAAIDGAGAVQKFLHVTWPHIRPVVLISTLLGGFLTFNTFEFIWLFTQGGPGTSTTTLPILVYQKAFMTWRTSEGAVISILMGIFLVVVLFLYFRLTPEEEF